MKLMIAEDDTDLREVLVALLHGNGFECDDFDNGNDALEHALKGTYSALILDIMMPGMDGLELVETLRNSNIFTPVMLLTAKTMKSDRIQGYKTGADDYLEKPFDAEELIVRIKALIRRNDRYAFNENKVGELVFNKQTAILSCGKESVRLSSKEFAMMELFMANPGKIFSSEMLMEKVWGYESDSDLSTVWVHLSNLRKKINDLNCDVTIRTVRGLGYLLDKND